jgi:hypothetical protein
VIGVFLAWAQAFVDQRAYLVLCQAGITISG